MTWEAMKIYRRIRYVACEDGCLQFRPEHRGERFYSECFKLVSVQSIDGATFFMRNTRTYFAFQADAGWLRLEQVQQC